LPDAPTAPAEQPVNVVPLKTNQVAAPAVEVGDCEAAVLEEFARLDPNNEHPVERMTFRRLAQVLDNPKLMDTWPRTSKELDALRSRLFGERRRKSKPGRTGNLSLVQQMSGQAR
jgi:hypothetical protein